MVIDSNIVIYSVQPEHESLRLFLTSNFIICSQITVLETLGYHLLTDDDKSFLESFFQEVHVVQIDSQVIKMAIQLKQKRKMSVGDSLIAATALFYDFPLVTNNVADFINVPDLRIINPLHEG